MRNELDIKAIRKALNMTQADLAEQVAVDQSTVSNWENGQAPRGPAKILLTGLAEKATALRPDIFKAKPKKRSAAEKETAQ